MKTAVLLITCCLITSSASAFQGQDNRVPPPPQGQAGQSSQEGFQVEARGQLHEAFASPFEPRQGPTTIVPKRPPEPVNELPPDQKPDGEDVEWIPGYWMWDEDRTDFLWVSGTWRVMPPERRWVPGYWLDVEGGYRWVSGYWYSEAETHVTLLPEPPAPVEEAVPALNETQAFVPGNWVYRSNTYWWQPGFTITQQPGWLWTPASYWWTPGGYVYTEGYWDYDLNRRGLAFAPVYIDVTFRTRPNWQYRPAYVINTDSFQSSLFVNTGWNHYFFGDYYDTGYSRRGYSPWYSYRSSQRQYDPLFNYYRFQNRGNQGWERQIQSTFAGRRDGSIARPSRTFTQNNVSNTVNNQVTNVNTIVSLNQWRGDQFKLQRLPQGEDRRIVDRYRSLSTERYRNERDSRTSLYPRDNNPGKNDTRDRNDGRDRSEGTKNPPLQNRDNNTGRNDTIPPSKSVLPGSKEGSRDNTARDNNTGRKDTMPPSKSVLPGSKEGSRDNTTRDNNTGRNDAIPPGKSVLPGSKEGSRENTTPGARSEMPGRRYELPKSNQPNRPATKVAPPQRPSQPQPVQSPAGRQGNPPPQKNPGKAPEKNPGKNPGKDG